MTDWIAQYQARRQQLRRQINGGALLFLGAPEIPRNYPHNTHPFRQDSTFLYLTGLRLPDLALWITAEGKEYLVTDPASIDSVVWTGPVPAPLDLAAQAGIADTLTWAQLAEAIRGCDIGREAIHHLTPTHAQLCLLVGELFNLPPAAISHRMSTLLRDSLIQQRLVKEASEIAEIEFALGVTDRMHRAVMAQCCPGVRESDLAATIEALALAEGCAQSYHPIVTVRGEILHNHGYGNRLESGQLLLNDSGAEAPSGYASDITRTLPVSGHFTAQQRAIYELVLEAQLRCIEAIKPGVPYRQIHDQASLIFARGLTDLGLMQGDPAEAVAAGAHAMFFCHGLGHALGLDVHDMEDYGEDAVGYGPSHQRSADFGTAYLRFARPLETGHVVTVEPGLYFIPTLFDLWEAGGKHRQFIRYDQLASWRTFGGIRIEDDVLVTPDGSRVLGPGIPKSPEEIESLVSA